MTVSTRLLYASENKNLMKINEFYSRRTRLYWQIYWNCIWTQIICCVRSTRIQKLIKIASHHNKKWLAMLTGLQYASTNRKPMESNDFNFQTVPIILANIYKYKYKYINSSYVPCRFNENSKINPNHVVSWWEIVDNVD